MRGTVAKRIRREHMNSGKTITYKMGANGMILADRNRRIYQLRKERYYNGETNIPTASATHN